MGIKFNIREKNIVFYLHICEKINEQSQRVLLLILVSINFQCKNEILFILIEYYCGD